MPYIVTTKRLDGDDRNCDCLVPAFEGAGQHSPGCACSKVHAVSRAVATLEEALRYADSLVTRDKHHDYVNRLDALYALPESGGTVGPLPDGTVIEVDLVSWWDLRRSLPDRADLREILSGWTTEAAIIDAYNAREASGDA